MKNFSVLVEGTQIHIRPFSSLQLLKKKIAQEHNLTSPFELTCQGKLLAPDHRSVHFLLKNNSRVEIQSSLEGGSESGKTFFWFSYFLILLPLFLLLLLSGFIPVLSSGLNVLASDGIEKIIKMFNKKMSPWLRVGLTVFFSLFRAFFIVFYVWALTFYIFFPWLYRRKGRTCASALTAKRLGWWTMVIFIFFYFLLNVVDLYFEVVSLLAGETPQLAQAFLRPANRGAKEAWDLAKFAPAYALFSPLMRYHQLIDGVLSVFYIALGEVGQFDCSDVANLKQLCSLTKTLRKIANPKGKDKITLEKNPLAEKVLKGVQKRRKMDQSQTLALNVALNSLKPTLRDWKLYPALSLLSRGLCDRYAEKSASLENKSPVYEVDSAYPVGSFNRWSARFFAGVVCALLNSMDRFQGFVYSVGNEAQVSNMIKTGSVAGFFSLIYVLGSLLYSWFVSRLFGLPAYG